MPQSPLAGGTDNFGNPVAMHQTRGGSQTKLNMTAAAVVKGSKGRVARVTIVSPGTTGGAFTLNDATTVGGANAGNVIWTLPVASALNVAGQVFDLDWPCANGIVLSAVPTTAGPIINVSYR